MRCSDETTDTPCSGCGCGSTTPTPTPTPTPTCVAQEYVCGDYTIKIDEFGCSTRTRTSNNLSDGVYTNATITLKDGCITHVSSGSRVIQQRPEPCTSASTTPPTPTGDIEINPSATNMLEKSSGVYGVFLHTNDTDTVALTGAGTATSPLKATFIGEFPDNSYTPTFKNGVAVRTTLVTPVVGKTDSSSVTHTIGTDGKISSTTVGVNVNTTDYEVENGLVKKFKVPITAITMGTAIQVAQDTTNPSVVTISVNEDSLSIKSKSIVGKKCGSSYQDPLTLTEFAVGTIVVIDNKVFVNTGTAGHTYDKLGLLIDSTPTIHTATSSAMAQAYAKRIYTFSLTAGC